MEAKLWVTMACDSLSLVPKDGHACMRRHKLPSVSDSAPIARNKES